MLAGSDLLPVLVDHFCNDSAVNSVVLFGSRARISSEVAAADNLSDIDLHIITSASSRITDRLWAESLFGKDLCLSLVRPASGGVQKATFVFSQGEVDLVILPVFRLRAVRLAMKIGLHHRMPSLMGALNAMSTIMKGGYRFIKGEKQWGKFYLRVTNEFPGYRLSDRRISEMADIFICDLLWVFRRIARGELVAAQRVIHNSLNEIMIQLVHEFRLRHNKITFQQARRIENLLIKDELSMVQVTAHLTASELNRAAQDSFKGFCALIGQLKLDWRVPNKFYKLLEPYL